MTDSAKLSEPTAAAVLAQMTDLGLAREITGKQRGKLYSYFPYVDLLAEGTEPLGAR